MLIFYKTKKGGPWGGVEFENGGPGWCPSNHTVDYTSGSTVPARVTTKVNQVRKVCGRRLRSIKVSDENSSVTKAFHFFKLISTPDFLCVQYAPFEAMPSIFNPF